MEADERVAAPLLAALETLEQKGVRLAEGHLGEDGERRVEIGDDLAADRHEITAVGGGVEGLAVWGQHATRNGLRGKRRRPPQEP